MLNVIINEYDFMGLDDDDEYNDSTRFVMSPNLSCTEISLLSFRYFMQVVQGIPWYTTKICKVHYCM